MESYTPNMEEIESNKERSPYLFATAFLIFSLIFFLTGGFLLIQKENKIKDTTFIESVLNADTSNLDEVIHNISEEYEKSPDKCLELLEKAFTQAYREGNYDQLSLVTEICLKSKNISKEFSEYLAFEYRDFAIHYLTMQLHEFVFAYETGTKNTIDTFPVLDHYSLISEVTLNKIMELIDEGRYEIILALLDFLDDKYDMSPIINSTIQPMLISKANYYTLGSFNVEIKKDAYVFKDISNGKTINLQAEVQYPGNYQESQKNTSANNNYGNSNSHKTNSNYGNNKNQNNTDYLRNDYGYGDPLPGESFSDYAKREDPELWSYMEDRWSALSDYDYGYGDPLPGESFSDYAKREDPELWNYMEDRWSTLSDSDYGYGDPKPGESFSDYAKREDPELWSYMEDRWDSLFGDY